MNYIVLDLEWNQGSRPVPKDVPTFEIIEIGAVKLDEQFHIVDTFLLVCHFLPPLTRSI